MADPLSKTLNTLAASRQARAVDVLLAALDAPSAELRDRAAEALLRRGSARGHVEVIKRFRTLGPQTAELLQRHDGAMATAIEHLLRHGDQEERSLTLEVVLAVEDYARLDNLLGLMHVVDSETRDRIGETIAALVDRLAAHSADARRADHVPKLGRNVADVRREVLTVLARAVEKPAFQDDRPKLVEWILILGDPDGFAVRQILWQGSSELRDLVRERLLTSPHPGVMRFVVESLGQKYPHPLVFECLATRRDTAFVEHLLRWLPPNPNPTQRRNLEQTERLAWLDGYAARVPELDGELQAKLFDFVHLLGVPRRLKNEVSEWIVRHGHARARRSASGHLDALDEREVRSIVFDGLADENPEVQAWATSQLRARRIPEAISLLLDRLDSEFDEVQEAARDELGGFNVSLLLGLHAYLPDDVSRRAGELIRKIDPLATAKFEEALTSPIRRQRVNAVKAARAFGLHHDLANVLVKLLRDEDPIVRRTVAEVLADVPRSEVHFALRGVLNDPSPRVRDAAANSLSAQAQLATAAAAT